VAVVGDLYAIDRVLGIAFDNGALTVDRAYAFVAEAGDCDAANGEMGGGDAGDFAAVAGGVVQADDVRHGCFLSCRCRHDDRWTHLKPATCRMQLTAIPLE